MLVVCQQATVERCRSIFNRCIDAACMISESRSSDQLQSKAVQALRLELNRRQDEIEFLRRKLNNAQVHCYCFFSS